MMRRTDDSIEGDEFGADDEDDVFPGAAAPAAPAEATTPDEEKPE